MTPHTVNPVKIVEACVLALLLLSLFVAGWPLVTLRSRHHARSRARRRGGYMHHVPSASGNANQATARARATSTGCKPDGRLREAPDGLALRAALSRTSAPTDSGYGRRPGTATATRPGIPTTDADA